MFLEAVNAAANAGANAIRVGTVAAVLVADHP